MAVVLIRSWHIVDDDRVQRTLCGRKTAGYIRQGSMLPGNAKTCERCAVIATRRGLTAPGFGLGGIPSLRTPEGLAPR